MNFDELMNYLVENTDKAEEISKLASPEDVYEKVKEFGYTGTFEEFSAKMAKFNEAASNMSSEEIEAVVGGADTTTIVSAVASTVGAAASVASAAAV